MRRSPRFFGGSEDWRTHGKDSVGRPYDTASDADGVSRRVKLTKAWSRPALPPPTYSGAAPIGLSRGSVSRHLPCVSLAMGLPQPWQRAAKPDGRLAMEPRDGR